MKHRNPKFGCVRIAQQIAHAFGIEIDKDVVRRVLAKHFRPEPGADGPSWLTLIAHAKDSVWSVDLFRVESILLRSHWVILVMDVFTRRIVGFGIAPACIDGVSVCRMFNCATAGQPKPKYLSTDHDPLFRFHRRLANLRVEEIKSVPYTVVSQARPPLPRIPAEVTECAEVVSHELPQFDCLGASYACVSPTLGRPRHQLGG
jgi:putative transposase